MPWKFEIQYLKLEMNTMLAFRRNFSTVVKMDARLTFRSHSPVLEKFGEVEYQFLIYRTFSRPILIYCVLAWSSASKSHGKILNVLQN